MPCKWEVDSKGIEATLLQIAKGLQSAAKGYLTLASHISKVTPYELPQVIAQIPPPPMYVPMPIRKALLVDRESKAVNYLIYREAKEDLEVPNIVKGENKWLKQRQQHRPLILKQ